MAPRPSSRTAWLALSALAVLSLLGSVAAVKSLSSSGFTAAASDGKVHIIKFYAPWCGHCKKLAPTWDELGSFFAKDARVSVSKVDCTVEKALCEKAEVRGYPTLKSYYQGRELEAYQGQRDLQSLKGWTINSLKKAGK